MTEGIFVFKYVQMVGKDKEDCVIFFLNLDYMESRAMKGFFGISRQFLLNIDFKYSIED